MQVIIRKSKRDKAHMTPNRESLHNKSKLSNEVISHTPTGEPIPAVLRKNDSQVKYHHIIHERKV